jgi:hypothetical protein
MDKSFNEQELSDIMKEIEALEDDFSHAMAASESEVPHETVQHTDALEEQVDSPVAEVDEVIEELAHMETPKAIPLKPKSIPKAVASSHHHPIAAQAASGTSMSLKVQGDLKLELLFDVGGKSVILDVSEKGLSIQMEGGVSFTVPLTGKKAA